MRGALPLVWGRKAEREASNLTPIISGLGVKTRKRFPPRSSTEKTKEGKTLCRVVTVGKGGKTNL